MNNKAFKYLVLLAFGLLIVAISSFWFSGPSFRESDVVVELDGPTEIASGGEVVYKLKYENKTRSTLRNLVFVFFYPEDSTVLSVEGLQRNQIEDFKVDELAPGEKGDKEFSAFLIGEKNSTKTAKVVFSFRASNLSSSFEKTVSLPTTIISTPISLMLVSPPNIVSDSNVQYILDYRNESDEDAIDLVLEFDYPDGFTFKNSTPSPDNGNNSWLVKSLKKGGGGRIEILGRLNGREGENKIVSAKLKRKVGGDYVDYQKVSSVTVISNPMLGLEVLVNDVSDYSASLGDRLVYTIKYKNNSNLTLSGMNLVVKLEGDMFDISRLDTRGGFLDNVNKTITWSSGQISDFSIFGPGVQGQITFSVAVKSTFSSAVPGASSDKFVKTTAKLVTPNVPIGVEGEEIAVSASSVTRIGSQPNFNQLIYYNDPGSGSIGPLPPQVGQETFFTVYWQLANPGNDTDNPKIVAKLPSGVMWADIARANENQLVPTFNPNSSEVTWTPSKLPYGMGINSNKYEASFKIKIKPTLNQLGSPVSLLESIQFTGNDSFTKQGIIINGKNLTTNNTVDRSGEGTVQ